MSFPDPVMGTVKRPVGQGCNSCVHQNYCKTFYWFLRADEKPDNYIGIQCASWSNNPADRILTGNADDVEYNNYYSEEGILIEPRRNEEMGSSDDCIG